MGSRTQDGPGVSERFEVVVLGVGQVAQGSFDGEAEQVADAADVAAGGSGFVEDPVFAHEVDGDLGGEGEPASADWCGAAGVGWLRNMWGLAVVGQRRLR